MSPVLDSTESRGTIMAARAYWQGHLRLSLVSFAIRLYPASIPARQIAFHQIDRKSGQRVRQQLIVPDKGPIERADIVKGYEYEKDHYIEIEPEDLDALRLPAKHTIDIAQFVGIDEIDPIYYDKPYYIVPDDKMALPAFATVRDAMKAARVAALGEIVFSGKEHLAAIRACGKGMILDTLRYADEVKKAAPFFDEIDKAEIDDDQIDMAKMLIKKKTAPLDMSKFNDSYEAAVKELVAAKLADKPLPKDEDEAPRGNVVNLMDALKRSLAGDEAEETPAKKVPAKKAAAKAPAKPAAKRARR
jgi:DNA end-binding protein Ku